MRVVVEADGGSRGNPGPAGYGAVVLDPDTGAVLAERFEAIGIETNNVAEYRGLIAGLQAAIELGATTVAVRMDSKLVVEQMSGRWQVKHPSMRPLAREAAALVGAFDGITFEWIPRERNKHADRLANQAMDAAAGKATAPAPVRTSPPPPAALSWTLPEGTATRLVLLRHGSTHHSPQRRFSGRNDLPLTEQGQQEVAGLAERVAERYPGVDAVLTSPLLRARETAAAVGGRLGLSPVVVDGFAELDFGEWEGLTGAEASEGWPSEHAAWLVSPDAAPPGGESMTTLMGRVRRARDDVIAKHPGQVVAVVTHVTPIKLLLRLALEAPPESVYRIFLDVASVSVLDYYPNGASVVRLVNGT